MTWDPPTGGVSLEGLRPGEEEPTHSASALWRARRPPIPPCSCGEGEEEGRCRGENLHPPSCPRSPSWPGTALGSGFWEATLRSLSNRAHLELLRICSFSFCLSSVCFSLPFTSIYMHISLCLRVSLSLLSDSPLEKQFQTSTYHGSPFANGVL